MQVQHFIEIFSNDRIQTYLNLGLVNDNLIEGYEINLKLSASFYVLLHNLELTLRNKIHSQLKSVHGEQWLHSKDILFPVQKALVSKAIERITLDNKEVTIPRIIAALPFSFWEHLFAPPYEKLWVTNLNKIFTSPPKKFTRKGFHRSIAPIRKLRNRIAHYECIIHCPIKEYYNRIIECTYWLSPEVSKWGENISDFLKIYKENKPILDMIICSR